MTWQGKLGRSRQATDFLASVVSSATENQQIRGTHSVWQAGSQRQTTGSRAKDSNVWGASREQSPGPLSSKCEHDQDELCFMAKLANWILCTVKQAGYLRNLRGLGRNCGVRVKGAWQRLKSKSRTNYKWRMQLHCVGFQGTLAAKAAGVPAQLLSFSSCPVNVAWGLTAQAMEPAGPGNCLGVRNGKQFQQKKTVFAYKGN